jgi:hypothetical protein
VLSLERAIFDDFGELLILAGNGHGIGAKKVLRSMYERLVRAMFMAKFPAEAKIFLAHSDIEKGKALNRAIATVPESVNRGAGRRLQPHRASGDPARDLRLLAWRPVFGLIL